VKNRVSS